MFDSNEDALKFLENKGLEEAHIQLLAELGKVLELSAIHAKNGHMLKAAEVLNASTARGTEHVRQMTKYLLVGLRQGFTIGIGPSELDASPTLSRLLELTDQLDKSAMAEKVSNEVSSSYPFRLHVLQPCTRSSRCSRQSDTVTTQLSARSPRRLANRITTLLLCCAWTVHFHLPSSFKVSHPPRSRRRSPFTSTTFAC